MRTSSLCFLWTGCSDAHAPYPRGSVATTSCRDVTSAPECFPATSTTTVCSNFCRNNASQEHCTVDMVEARGGTETGPDAQQSSADQGGRANPVTPVTEQNSVQKAPAPKSGPVSRPASDPRIHTIAQRAEEDPKLKSVTNIVAGGQASKEQLEFFQTHMNESAPQVHTTGKK
jgi:hypothetical protein